MKNSIISQFVQNSTGNTKAAFIYNKKNQFKKVSFENFLRDIFKMNSFLDSKLKGNTVLIYSYPYSYSFYVGIFSCLFSGRNIVIIDSFKDRNKTAFMLQSSGVTDILCDDFTSKMRFLIPGKNHFVNVSNFESSVEKSFYCDSASVITFTSGTTGMPKLIKRSVDFLQLQVEIIKNNVDIGTDELTYSLLPMYSLFCLFMNQTCLITRKLSVCRKFNVQMMLIPIKKVCKIKEPLHSVRKVFLGGAILYHDEAERILQKFPSADITYVYGASEGAIIYKTKLNRYVNAPFTFDEKSNGIDVCLVNKDEDGAGEIVISGKTVIGSDKNQIHYTGDYGKIVEGKLVIIGRKKYCNSKLSFYNYEYDEFLRSENPMLKAGFSFYYNGAVHVVYTGKIKKNEGIIYHHFTKLPYDLKHKTKLDYGKVIAKIEKI